MMTDNEASPLVALVDDDTHSARLMARTLARFCACRIRWYGGAQRARRLLADALGQPGRRPAMLVVDLKANSTATRDFIAAIAAPATAGGVAVIAVAPSLERSLRDGLIAAGASAVFERRAEAAGYQSEIAELAGFLDRHVRDTRRRPPESQTASIATGLHETAPRLND